ncbi:hypothetical protein CsSME_00050396 [Camellia sinensis var. sinensis]
MDLINSSLNLKCKGRIYPVRVCEEQIIKEVLTTCKGTNTDDGEEDVSSNVNGVLQSAKKSKREEEEDDKATEVDDDMAGKNEKAKGESITSRLNEGGEVEVGDSWLQISVVKKTEECMGKSNEEGSGVRETMMAVESIQ